MIRDAACLLALLLSTYCLLPAAYAADKRATETGLSFNASTQGVDDAGIDLDPATAAPSKARNLSTQSTSRQNLSAAEKKHRDMVYRVARDINLDPALLMAVVKVESNFNHRAQNPDGPLGLTQITHSTARTVKPGIRRADLLEPEKNLRVGGLHLKHLLDEFKDPKLALAAYQAGTGRVKDVGHGILRHPHTGAHVSKVMHQYQEYKRQDAPSSQMTTSKTLSSKRSVATRVASNTKPATGPATRKNSSASGRIKSKNSQRA